MNEPHPSAEETRRLLADADTVPVVLTLPVGELTPVAAMRALGVDTGCFLLESVDGIVRTARWSMLGHRPTHVITGAEDPLDALQRTVAARRMARVDGISAPLLGGAVGYLAYDAARRYERLPEPPVDPLGVPDAWFGVFDTVTVFDHAQQRLLLASCVQRDAVDGFDAEYARAVRRIEGMRTVLEHAGPDVREPPDPGGLETAIADAPANMSRDTFSGRVGRALDYILAGDIFQVQVSRRFALPLDAHPFELYEVLRRLNPSPYMFYIATPDCTLVGASPEMLVQVTGREVRYHPIAGTRRRGRTPEDDARMATELLSSEKEAAEHLMLVDLGRNDLGRVCETGSVRVTQQMEIERYSHVMHLVSSIEGSLAAGGSSVDALRACFPAGTVTGAPKIRAMEIISELEGEARGPYAGAAGYVGYGGDLDMAIALRTIVVRDGVAHVQAAAGIVADSTASEEALEIDNKVLAQVLAVGEANRRRRSPRESLAGGRAGLPTASTPPKPRTRAVSSTGPAPRDATRQSASPTARRRGDGTAAVIVVDNFDSFTYNLVQYLRELGASVVVVRNDAASVTGIASLHPSAIVMSPGPRTPREAGICVELVRELGSSVPMLGVCLGHQAIGVAYGADVVRAPAVVHGKVGPVWHTGVGVLEGIESPLTATRYHSLVVEREGLPDMLEVTAWSDDGLIMAMQHRDHPLHGVQFHPESIGTPSGRRLLANFLACAGVTASGRAT